MTKILTLLPNSTQRSIYDYSGIKSKNLTFEVQPNSIWTAYEIQNETIFLNKIPPNCTISPISVFSFSREPKKYLFFNLFDVKTTYFDGTRLEIVTVIFDERTQKNRFLILDYYSNAISSDPTQPFKNPNTDSLTIRVRNNSIHGFYEDKYYVHGRKNNGRNLVWTLTPEFGIDCNRQIFYGSQDDYSPNILWFDEYYIRRVNPFYIDYIWNNLYIEGRKQKPDFSFYYEHSTNFTITPEISI
jgi:hypothetical protein